MVGVPEERPAISLVFHLRRRVGRGASVCGASAVRSSVGRVVFVVCLKDGKSLLGVCSGVVAALGGLDVGGDLFSGARNCVRV